VPDDPDSSRRDPASAPRSPYAPMAAGFFLLALPLVLAAILAESPTGAFANGLAAALFAGLGGVLALLRKPPA
jgi:hypothetical protein